MSGMAAKKMTPAMKANKFVKGGGRAKTAGAKGGRKSPTKSKGKK